MFFNFQILFSENRTTFTSTYHTRFLGCICAFGWGSDPDGAPAYTSLQTSELDLKGKRGE